MTSEHFQRIGLVGCVKRKCGHPAPAKDLYVSPLFVGRRRYVECSCDRWFILSALHGLVPPELVLEPYDVSLVGASSNQKRRWAQLVLASLDGTLGGLRGLTFEIHAGAAYRDFGLVQGLRSRGAGAVIPAEGLTQGQQLAFYSSDRVTPDVVQTAKAGIPRSLPSGHGSYRALSAYLSELQGWERTLTFGEIEEILGRSLPPSARQYQAWWANTLKGHPHARSWLDVGWRTNSLDLNAARITFVRKP